MIPKAVMRRAHVRRLLLCLMGHTLVSIQEKKNQAYFDQALFRPWLHKSKKTTAHLKEKMFHHAF